MNSAPIFFSERAFSPGEAANTKILSSSTSLSALPPQVGFLHFSLCDMMQQRVHPTTGSFHLGW
jgi:hypothetical protein